MNYQEMSDSEVNLRVAKITCPNDGHSIPYYHRADVQIFHDNGCCSFKDYCNSWADAGPIIQDNLISISSRCANGEWKASVFLGREDIFDNYASYWDKNPLRAICIVFLMMKGGE